MSAEGFFGPGEQSLVDMFQMWGYSKATGILTVKSGNEDGEVHLDSGKVVWANFGPFLVNEDAVYYILSLEEGRFRFVNTINIKRAGIWSATCQEIMLEAMRRLDHLKNEQKSLDKKLALIPEIVKDVERRRSSDDERVFLGLIDGRRNLMKIFDSCGFGNQRCLEIFDKLQSEGVTTLRKIKVLVVDDQAVWRKVISFMLAKEPYFEVVGTASNGIDALKKLSEHKPDVMTLDLEMPKLDGIKALYWMMSGSYEILLKSYNINNMGEPYRCPVVVISAVATLMAPATLYALMGGASGYITKPSRNVSESLARQQKRIAKTVLLASQVDMTKIRRVRDRYIIKSDNHSGECSKKVICVGTSMVGGLTSLMHLLPSLPQDLDASVFIVIDDLESEEHSKSFADFLDKRCEVSVRPADRSAVMKKGTVYISAGSNLVSFGQLRTGQTAFKIRRNGRESRGRRDTKPIDTLLISAIRCRGFDKRIGVVLAGDGTDGKVGSIEMARFGEKVFAQDSYSSLNPAKPDRIAGTGVARVVPLKEMAKKIIDEVGRTVN